MCDDIQLACILRSYHLLAPGQAIFNLEFTLKNHFCLKKITKKLLLFCICIYYREVHSTLTIYHVSTNSSTVYYVNSSSCISSSINLNFTNIQTHKQTQMHLLSLFRRIGQDWTGKDRGFRRFRDLGIQEFRVLGFRDL